MNAIITAQATLNNSSNYFVFAWYTASAPGVLVNSIQVLPKPYGVSFQATLTGLTSQVYIVKLWESADATPTGTVRNSMNFLPSSSTTTVRMPEYLTADVTPGLVSNTSTYVNLTYAGWGYKVERKPNGTMFVQGAPNVVTPDYAQDVAGGFHLTIAGDVFGVNEQFVVEFLPQVAPAAASAGGILTTGVIINAARVLDSTYLNQAIFLQGTGSTVPITLPVLSTVSDYQWMYFFSAGGSHISAPITCAGTDKIQWNALRSQLILCQTEQLKIFKANGVWNVDYASPSINMVGELIYKYTHTDFNYVFADGSLLSRANYARLYAYYNSGADGSVAEASWAATTTLNGVAYFTNKAKWTQGDGSTTFRVPLLTSGPGTGTGFIRCVDGTGRLAGSFQSDALEDVQFDSVGNGNNPPFDPNGQGPIKNVGGWNGIVNVHSSLSSHAGLIIGGTFTPSGKLSYETRPQNIGAYALIRI